MKKIAVLAVCVCVLGAFVVYPPLGVSHDAAMETLSPQAMTQAAPTLPIESYQAI